MFHGSWIPSTASQPSCRTIDGTKHTCWVRRKPCEEQTLCFEGEGCGCLPAMSCGVVVVNSHEHKAHGVLDRRETCMAPRPANAAKSPWATVTSYSLVDRAKDRQCDDWHHGQDRLTSVGHCPERRPNVWVGMLRSALRQNVPSPIHHSFFPGSAATKSLSTEIGQYPQGSGNHQPVLHPRDPNKPTDFEPSPNLSAKNLPRRITPTWRLAVIKEEPSERERIHALHEN